MSEYRTVQFGGGLNSIDTPLNMPPGEVLVGQNYEIAATGGYRRIDGYARFDGRLTYADVIEVPGEGRILGVAMYNDKVYAFRNVVGGASAKMFVESAAGWVEVVTGVTLNPDGNYEFIVENFYGHSGSRKLYGVDGQNKGFQFDGTTFTQITTGMTTDTPSHLTEFRSHLFYSFEGGSVQHSPPGDPTALWTPVLGASELGIGDEVVGFKVEIDESLFIFANTRIKRLTGTSSTDWNLVNFSKESGAKANSIQRIGRTFFIDERGLIDLSSSQAYGDFKGVMASEKIEDVINPKLNSITASTVSKNKNQYRVFFDDNTAIEMTVKGNKIIGFMVLSYAHVIRCIVAEEKSDGTEEIYFGSDDGYVRRLDYGTSFDSQEIEALIRLPYHHYKTPQRRKRFRSMKLDLDAVSDAVISFSADLGYGSPEIPSTLENSFSILGGGGFWGSANWNEFSWSVQPILDARIDIDGVSENMSVLFYSKTATEQPHTLFSMLVRFDYRGAIR